MEDSATSSTPVTRASFSIGSKKKDNSKIVYYNCIKNVHISWNCSESPKDNAIKK